MTIQLGVLLILVVVAMLVLSMPLIRYLHIGWHAKRADIMDGLNAESRLKYFQMFCKSDAPRSGDEAIAALDAMYTRWYGRRLFLAPLLLLLIVGIASIYLAVGSVFRMQGLLDADRVILDMRPIGIAAIAGAYMWVVNDLISRARRLDLSPADVHWCVLRLTIAVPMGFSIAAIASESAGPFVAFAAGAFPLATITKLLQRAVAAKVGYSDESQANNDDLVKLQGVNAVVVDRLSNEDITTITQVAYCDPIRLTMRSNLTFNVVTDLMNQALGWQYLDDGLNKIRPLGMRGAVEIKHFVDALAGTWGKAAKVRAEEGLPEIAKALGQTPATLVLAFGEIAEDPFTDYLESIWI